MLSIATVGATLSIGAGIAIAGETNVTEDQILHALSPAKKPLTRGLSVGPQVDPAKRSCRPKALRSEIRNRATRSLSSGEREQIATIAQEKPKIDLEINFDYNSADISNKSMPSVQALGKALTNPDLKGSTFVVAGYTDAAGRRGLFNSTCPSGASDAIKRYLTDKFGIAGSDLVTDRIWQDEAQGPRQSDGEANRRVQVVNLRTRKPRPVTPGPGDLPVQVISEVKRS